MQHLLLRCKCETIAKIPENRPAAMLKHLPSNATSMQFHCFPYLPAVDVSASVSSTLKNQRFCSHTTSKLNGELFLGYKLTHSNMFAECSNYMQTPWAWSYVFVKLHEYGNYRTQAAHTRGKEVSGPGL